MDLGGGWRCIAADETLGRVFFDPDLDDGDWPEIPVPHHWRSHHPFEASDGPLLYRRPFEDQVEPGGRAWLQFDGLFYQGDVWLDGSYLGDTEGYFFPHTFEITDALRARSEHLLAVEVACARPADRRAKRNLTGVFQHWDSIDPAWNPGGIWAPVAVVHTGPVRIVTLRLACRDASAERATLDLRLELDAVAAAAAVVETTIADDEGQVVEVHTEAHNLSVGANQVSWRIGVAQPRL